MWHMQRSEVRDCLRASVARANPSGRAAANPRGFMLIDAIIGMAVVGAVMVVMAVAMGRERRAAGTLAQTRRAVRAAEAALTELQAGRTMPMEMDGATVQIQNVPGTVAPPGFRWVEVRATSDGRQAALAGLVPAKPAGKGTP